jgi:methionine-gamma-lyase
MKNQKVNMGTLCVREHPENKTTKSHQLPIYATSSFAFETIEEGIEIFTGKKEGHVYSRYANPTVDTVANKLAKLEAFGTDKNAYAYLTSSGMAAISSIGIALLKSGDKILTQGNLYGGTTELFKKLFSRMGIETIFTDLNNLSKVESYLEQDNAIKMIYFETPANPTLACVDLAEMSRIAKKHHKITVIDNTFPTPYLQQPLKYDIDFVIHSTTKFLNGHGNSISGVIIGWKEEWKKKVWEVIKLAGTNTNAWDAWLLNNGLKTLALRMDRHCSNAMELATYLEQHQSVNFVNYIGLDSHPHHHIAKKQMSGFGGMLSFEVKGGQERALRFMNKLQLATMAPTLGDVDTLVLHPATSSHLNVERTMREANGITDGLIRISTGIEDIRDIIADIDQALG